MQYINDVIAEMKKVNWPTREMLVASTVIVIIISLLFAAYIMGVDWVLNRVVGFFLEG
ncbi:MAG: preprotein translocase subunit SecE [Fibrobacteres bacterium]|nr:preprotein translocase subunit SecE [Fibrobacterota bacterium]